MNEQEKIDTNKSFKERFIRWQQLAISQLSFANNLFLGLNLGFLSFYVTQSGLIFSCSHVIFTIQLFTMLGFTISFFTGVLVVLNRLTDFRTTYKLIKKRKEKFEHEKNIKSHSDFESIKAEISNLKASSDELGRTTWTLFKWQIWTFFIGVIFGVIFLILKANAND